MAEGRGDEELWLLKHPIEIRQSSPGPSPSLSQAPSSKVKRSSKMCRCLPSRHSPAEERRLATNLDKGSRDSANTGDGRIDIYTVVVRTPAYLVRPLKPFWTKFSVLRLTARSFPSCANRVHFMDVSCFEHWKL